jgi:hypothetical protein
LYRALAWGNAGVSRRYGDLDIEEFAHFWENVGFSIGVSRLRVTFIPGDTQALFPPVVLPGLTMNLQSS